MMLDLLKNLGSLDPLSFVVPKGNLRYEWYLHQRSENASEYPHLQGLLPSLWVFLVCLVLRAAWGFFAQKSVASVIQKRFTALQQLTPQEMCDKVTEQLWLTGNGLVFLGWSWYLLQHHNGGCTLKPDSSACLRNWPLLPLNSATRFYYNMELGWYLQLLLKHHLGLGPPNTPTMAGHHMTSVALLLLSYCFSLHRAGVLLLATLNLSSPILHISKMAHQLHYKQLAIYTFLSFGLVFFATRLVLFSTVILPLTLVTSVREIPEVRSDFPVMYTLISSLIMALFVMQLVWMWGIIRVLREAAGGDDAKLQSVTQQQDWAVTRCSSNGTEVSDQPSMEADITEMYALSASKQYTGDVGVVKDQERVHVKAKCE